MRSVTHVVGMAMVGIGVLLVLWCGYDFYQRGEMSVYKRQSQNQNPMYVSSTTKPTRIIFLGDMMLDRAVRTKIEAQGSGYPFVHIRDFLRQYDMVVANAEGPFTHHTSVSMVRPNTLLFTFDPKMLPILKTLGFTVLSQANNHALNFGYEGLRESQTLIREQGMEVFGDPANQNPGPVYRESNGITVAYIGYHAFMGTSTRAVRAAITAAREHGAWVVVYPHWGVEYDQSMNAKQQSLAHQYIDAGADVVIGVHPHVIQPIEVYKGKLIVYSLGNFIFDQSNSGPTAEGLALEAVVSTSAVAYTFHPIHIVHAQAQFASSVMRERICTFLGQSGIGFSAEERHMLERDGRIDLNR